MGNKLTIIVSADITFLQIEGDFFSEGQATIFSLLFKKGAELSRITIN